MKIYISGKISGLPANEFANNFNKARLFLRDNYDWGCEIINPLDINPFLGVKSWFCYMTSDLLALRKCTHIALQKNWVDSKGACVEYFFAKFIFKLEVVWL